MEKKAICLLTRILRCHGISSCSAETFRLAKHDQIEAVVPMWNLLKNMIENIFYQHRMKKFTEHCNDIPAHHHQYDDTSVPQVILFVQHEFHKLGYMSRDFYQLSHNNGLSGSRDLLLAFAWLICHVDFIDLLLKMMSFSELAAQKYTGMIVPMNDRGVAKIPPSWNITDCVKHMTLIHGKLTLTCRHLYALQQEKNRLAHKLHVSTQGMSLQPSSNHLTPEEAQLLSTKGDKLASHLQKINSRIEDILKWKESENVFWKWMESVVTLKTAVSKKFLYDSQNGSEGNEITNSAGLGHMITANEKLCLQGAKKKLNETIIQYDLCINNLERVWHKKQPTLSKKEHSKILLDFHTKVKELDVPNIENSSWKEFHFVHQKTDQHSYCYECPGSQVKNEASAVNKSVEEDTVYVNEKSSCSQKRLEIELDLISNEFQHLICIPVSK